MRVTVNEPFLRRRANIARWTTLIGLGILVVGLLVSFNEQYYYLSLPALIVGFILANISGYNSNRYVKEPRPDQSLARLQIGHQQSVVDHQQIGFTGSAAGALHKTLIAAITELG